MMEGLNLSAYIDVGFSEKELNLLFENCPEVNKEKNEYLYKPGDILQKVYYLQKGEIKFFIPQNNGSNRTLFYQREGSYFGVISSFLQIPLVDYCEALKPCVFLSCPVDIFWERVQKYDLARKLLALECKKRYLLQLRFVSNNINEFVGFLINDGLTQQEIADIIGYSRVQVSRICSQLKKESA